MSAHTRKDNVSLPIATIGTFSVQLPQATGVDFNTIVVAPGVLSGDALSVSFNKHTSGAYGFENSTAYILVAAQPSEGSMILFFQNLGNATGYVDRIGTYLAGR